MAGALADFSRRPLQYKVLVFVGIGAVLGLLYWQFMLSPLRKERDAAAADLDSQKSEADKLKAQKKKYDDLIRDEAKLKDEIEQNQKALPTEAEMPAFIDMLSRKTSEAGVEMLKREVKKDITIDAIAGVAAGATAPAPAKGAPAATPPASFVKVPVDIEVTGTYYQLKKFMASLRPRRNEPAAPPVPGQPGQTEEKDRIVTIESLTILDPKVKNNEIILTARFVAATFRSTQVEPVPGAKPATPPPAPGATPAKPAAGDSSGPATSVPGGAPGAAKVKTEAAMDKSEERVKNSPGGAP